MKSKKTITIFLVGILNFIWTIIEIGKLKNHLPIKIFESNVVSKMEPKSTLYIFPIVILILCLVQVFYRVKTMDKAVTKGKIIEDFIFTLATGVMILLEWSLIYIGQYYTKTNLVDVNLPLGYLAFSFIGVLTIAIFSTFPINKYKSKLGIRTKETLEDEKVWRITNRFAGFTGALAGLCISLAGLYFAENGFNGIMLAVLVVICFFFMYYIPASYSSFVRRKLNNKK